jgi:hypothetical protein
MRARLLLLAAAVVPFAATAVAHGCSNQQFESACLWISDPTNCFREFREDMVANVGTVDNPNGDCRPTAYDAGFQPTEVYANPANQAGVSNGSFTSRSMLGTCILNQGGSIVFNPAITADAGADAGPTTYQISFIESDGNPCGQATFTDPYDWSITINSFSDAGADAGFLSDGGTYTESVAPGTEELTVACPSGETHVLNLNEVVGPPGLDGGPTSSCPGFAPLMPTASLQMFFGGVNVPGAVSFAISYPPTPAQESYPDASELLATFTPPLTPVNVVYFNCSVPAAPELCADGVQDGNETDIDCGGPQMPSTDLCGMCPARCEVSQQCICNGDCDRTMGLVCSVNEMTGMRQCGPSTVDGGAVKQFTTCSYNPDAPPPCTVSDAGTGAGGSGAGGGSGSDGGPADAGTD